MRCWNWPPGQRDLWEQWLSPTMWWAPYHVRTKGTSVDRTPALKNPICMSDGRRCSSHSTGTLASTSSRQCAGGRDPAPSLWEQTACLGRPTSTVQGRVPRDPLRSAHREQRAHGYLLPVNGKPCRKGVGASSAGQGPGNASRGRQRILT